MNADKRRFTAFDMPAKHFVASVGFPRAFGAQSIKLASDDILSNGRDPSVFICVHLWQNLLPSFSVISVPSVVILQDAAP
jgi:hypothetical protein